MNYKLKAKRLGEYWYLDLDHIDPKHIQFNDKIDKVLNLYDIYNAGELEIELTEVYSVIQDNTIFFDEKDLLRFFTTADDIKMKFYLRDHVFWISSDMYSLIEQQLNPNFHKTYYTIDILN